MGFVDNLRTVLLIGNPMSGGGRAGRHLNEVADALGRFVPQREVVRTARAGDAQEAARRAASRLAVLLEDDRPQVAAAAALWQASLRARESDPSRAMSVLGLVLSRPRQGTLPFAFFARLLRCRILASRGGHAVALALLTQLEDRSDIWMAREADRTNALRAITLVEIQVLRDWYARLPGPPDSPQRQWCVDRVKTLIDEHFSEDGSTVFRLTAAIPIVAVPEDAGRREPEAPQGED